jgi:hypothetical protein
MRSSSEDRDNAGASGPAGRSRRAAGWVWWGLVAAFTMVMALSVAWAVRSGSAGQGRNRGPADEAAPGTEPSRHIDRSSNRQ